MRKTIITFLAAALLFVAMPFAISAQTSERRFERENRRSTRHYREDKNVYERHRNVFNVAIGAGAGAIAGAIFGGKKGALIGAGVGAGAGAAYTYGINPKDKKPKKRKRFRRNY